MEERGCGGAGGASLDFDRGHFVLMRGLHFHAIEPNIANFFPPLNPV
jgi:heterogeneous nuclear ribonucleoprotein F/H